MSCCVVKRWCSAPLPYPPSKRPRGDTAASRPKRSRDEASLEEEAAKRPRGSGVEPSPRGAAAPIPGRLYTAEEVEAIVAQRMAVKEREHQERLVEQFNQFRRFCEDSVSHQLNHLGECAYMS